VAHITADDMYLVKIVLDWKGLMVDVWQIMRKSPSRKRKSKLKDLIK